MASALGTLALNLVARTDKFEKGMKRSSKRMTAMQKSIGLLKKAAIGLGAAFSVRMFAGAIKGSLEMMDSIGKLSDRVGIATETLTGLGHAATIAGMDSEAFNSTLEKLAKNIGDVNMKNGEARYALEQLGLEADKIANMGLDNALLLIADEFNKLSNETEQAAVVTSLFGRSGYDLINFLKLGSDGIRDLIKENEELGGSFTREQAAMAEAANDAIERMKKAWGSFGRAFATEVAEPIEGLATVLQNMAEIDPSKQGGFSKWYNDFKKEFVTKNRKMIESWARSLSSADVVDYLDHGLPGWTEEERAASLKKQQDDPVKEGSKSQLDSNRYAVDSIQIWNNVGDALGQAKKKALDFFDSIQEKLQPYLDTVQEFKFEILSDEDKMLKNLEDKHNKYAEAISKVFGEGTDAFETEMEKLNKWFEDQKTDIKTPQDYPVFEPDKEPLTDPGSLLEVGKYIDAVGLINKDDYDRQMVAEQKETNRILRTKEEFSGH